MLASRFLISGEKRFDVSAHRVHSLLYVELEAATGEGRWDLSALEKAMRTLRAPRTLRSLYSAIPPLIRTLTGYDRVMIYRFDHDGHGEVVAEAKDEQMEPFLGLHYPATDIPAQARRLYLLQRLRTLVDINYVPVPVPCHPTLACKSPLDMTYCGLRSVSPIQVEYLQNMGVGASLALSLVQQGELWGMIVRHHRTCRQLALELRGVCDLLGQHISVLIGTARQSDEDTERAEKSAILSAIGEALATSLAAPGSIEAAMSSQELLRLVHADGALIHIGAHAQLIGSTPPLAEQRPCWQPSRANSKEEHSSLTISARSRRALPALSSRRAVPYSCRWWNQGKAFYGSEEKSPAPSTGQASPTPPRSTSKAPIARVRASPSPCGSRYRRDVPCPGVQARKRPRSFCSASCPRPCLNVPTKRFCGCDTVIC